MTAITGVCDFNHNPPTCLLVSSQFGPSQMAVGNHDSEGVKKTDDPVCHLCGKPVLIESAKTDDEGNTVHEMCYVRWMLNRASRP